MRESSNIWNFIVRESSLQEMANLGDYPGDLRLQSGDREIRFKIWSLPDCPGELTAQKKMKAIYLKGYHSFIFF